MALLAAPMLTSPSSCACTHLQLLYHPTSPALLPLSFLLFFVKIQKELARYGSSWYLRSLLLTYVRS